ncbi:YopX family protein [Bacillus sp. 2CMS4F]|uniref:YopX family protein n=1 Tax=Bacillus sp. 2CMS4F TaxID=2929170 RepID=UPI0020C08AFB|nr:YopX family protein [Bacillus sp. 2CMS4F]MCK8098686.1 YopX family protein [Bacillus sp. 2CMS4F]
MRQIKFRAWHKKWDRLINDIFLGDSEVKFPIGNTSDILDINEEYSNLIFQQYTGFKDKNDREIYEGDIVKVTNGAEELGGVDTGIGKVEWLTKWGFWNVSKIENGLGDLLFNGYVEVIGNIYEDPQLLEAAE